MIALNAQKLKLGDPLGGNIDIVNANPSFKVLIDGVDPSAHGSGSGDLHDNKFTNLIVENPQTTNNAKAANIFQDVGTENLKITCKNTTGSAGIITLQAENSTNNNRLEVFNGGVTTHGVHSSQGPVQVGNGGSIFNTLVSTDGVVTGSDLDLAINSAGTNGKININPNNINSVEFNNTETQFKKQFALGTEASNLCVFSQVNENNGLNIGTSSTKSLVLNSEGELEMISNNGTSSTIKLKIGTNSTNVIDVNGNTLCAEGDGRLNRLCNSIRVTENNTPAAILRECQISMGTSNTDLNISTSGTGAVVMNNSLKNIDTGSFTTTADGTGTPISAPIYFGLDLFKATRRVYTNYINVQSLSAAEQCGIGGTGSAAPKIITVINTGNNTPPFGTAPTMFYPFIEDTQQPQSGLNTAAMGVPLYALAAQGVSMVEIQMKFFRTNPWPNQSNWNGDGSRPTAPNITAAMLQGDLFPHFKTTDPVTGAGTVTSNVIDNWTMSFNFSIPNNNGNASNNVLFSDSLPMPVTHSYESKARFQAGGAATIAFQGNMPVVNYFTDTATNITGFNLVINTSDFQQDQSLLDPIFLMTQVRVLGKYVGTEGLAT